MEMKRDPAEIRSEFPILSRKVHGHDLVYLDNSATTQKPRAVIQALTEYYENHNANVHRGVHTLSDESTHIYETARKVIAQFFGATGQQLILTRNTTEAINTLVQMWKPLLHAGDVIAVSLLEHHSNFVPWQMAALELNCELVVLPLTAQGEFAMDEIASLLESKKDRLRVLTVPVVSNALGTVAPISELVSLLSDWGIRDNVLVSVDGAQAAAHVPIHMGEWQIDALSFSGHKMYGPMGIGGLILSPRILKMVQPVSFGGGMIDEVHIESTSFHPEASERFTAGTPDVASVYGLQRAIEFLASIGWPELQEYEHSLLTYLYEQLQIIPQVTVVGPAPTTDMKSRIGSVSWVYDGVHAHDVAQILDRSGIAVRSGHHCTMPLHEANDWVATTRASLAVYNTHEDIDRLVAALHQVKQVFGK